MELSKKRLWLFDVDNTLVLDVERPKPFSDALGLCKVLHEKHRILGILTNVGRLSSRQVHVAVTNAGFSFDLDKTFSAGSAAAAYVKNRDPMARCFVISEGGARDDFVCQDLIVTSNPPIDYVAVGADRNMTYQELNFATKMVRDGANLICISGSRDYPGVFMGYDDVYIGERSITAAIEDATGVEAIIVGKPLPEIFVETAKTIGFSPSETVMVGDNPASDIAGGNAAGMTTVLVDRNPDDIVPFDDQGLNTSPDISVGSLEDVIDLL